MAKTVKPGVKISNRNKSIYLDEYSTPEEVEAALKREPSIEQFLTTSKTKTDGSKKDS